MGWTNDQFVGELTIPTGATTGARITINHNNDGAIKVYDSSNVLIAEISNTADVIKTLTAAGVYAKLDPTAPSAIAATTGPGLVLGGMSGDVEPGSLTEFDDTFRRGLFLRTPSAVVDISALEGVDYAAIEMTGKFHGNDPQIIMSAGDTADAPAGFIAINGMFVDPSSTITSYGGPVTYAPGSSGGGIATFSTHTGWYFRIGPIILFEAYYIVNVAGSGGAAFQPRTPTNVMRGMGRQVVTAHVSGVSGPGTGEYSALFFDGGSGTTIDRLTRGGTDLTGANLLAGAIITIQGWYWEDV